MTQPFDQDIVEALETLTSVDVVKKALTFVKDVLPESIEVQKELALIEAPSYREEEKTKRYAALLIEAGLEEVRIAPTSMSMVSSVEVVIQESPLS